MKNIKDIKQLISKITNEFSFDESIDKEDLINRVWDSLLSDEENKNDYLESLAFEELKSETGKHFNRHVKSVKGTDIAQIEFMNADFNHIQSRYAITVNNKTVLVPTHLMDAGQFNQQISLHTKQGEGHLAHASELRTLKHMVHGNGADNDPEFFDVDH